LFLGDFLIGTSHALVAAMTLAPLFAAALVLGLPLGCGGAVDAFIDDGDAAVDARDAAVDARDAAPPPPGLDASMPPDNTCPIPSSDPSPNATIDLAGSCSEGQNTAAPIDTNCGGVSVAWEYVPKHDLDVTRIELNDTGGGVALYDSDCDMPGAKLFEGSVPSGGPRSWRGADVSPPIRIVAGHRYFIEQITPPEGDVCSVATDGVAQRQFNTPGFCGPGWGGPYIWLNWTAHILGNCPGG
jgi:hypothetical protein